MLLLFAGFINFKVTVFYSNNPARKPKTITQKQTSYPRTTSSTIISANPSAKHTVPTLECSP